MTGLNLETFPPACSGPTWGRGPASDWSGCVLALMAWTSWGSRTASASAWSSRSPRTWRHPPLRAHHPTQAFFTRGGVPKGRGPPPRPDPADQGRAPVVEGPDEARGPGGTEGRPTRRVAPWDQAMIGTLALAEPKFAFARPDRTALETDPPKEPTLRTPGRRGPPGPGIARPRESHAPPRTVPKPWLRSPRRPRGGRATPPRSRPRSSCRPQEPGRRPSRHRRGRGASPPHHPAPGREPGAGARSRLAGRLPRVRIPLRPKGRWGPPDRPTIPPSRAVRRGRASPRSMSRCPTGAPATPGGPRRGRQASRADGRRDRRAPAHDRHPALPGRVGATATAGPRPPSPVPRGRSP